MLKPTEATPEYTFITTSPKQTSKVNNKLSSSENIEEIENELIIVGPSTHPHNNDIGAQGDESLSNHKNSNHKLKNNKNLHHKGKNNKKKTRNKNKKTQSSSSTYHRSRKLGQ